MSGMEFRSGEVLMHADRPEWGVGTVLEAQPVVQEGQAAQRLRIRFERVGVKTLSTLYAKLRKAEQTANPAVGSSEQRSNTPTSWLDELEAESPEQTLSRLPDAATDPFAPVRDRLRETLRLYRFEPSGASLIDWAATQSGLADPLTRFNRQELEAFFPRFAEARQSHLRSLIAEARRTNPDAIQTAARSAPPQGVEALRRLLASR